MGRIPKEDRWVCENPTQEEKNIEDQISQAI
jgi:hypothetical protein